MFRPIALSVLVAVCVTLPATHRAAADDAANVMDVTMMVDAKLNGKDTWSPGGRELDWSASKCPVRIQFKGVVQVDKPTKITYRWEHADGETTPTVTFDVKKAGASVEVAPLDVRNVGQPGATYRGAETFHVLTPSDLSTTTPIKVECAP
jgi:hypothetical protein